MTPDPERISTDVVPPIILASASPRRRALLEMLGFAFEVAPADIDETYDAGESGPDHALRLAREKAATVARDRPDAIVVGSDTVVCVGDVVLGKPRDDDEAVAMLLSLSGRTHHVATGVAVVSDGTIHAGVEVVSVTFQSFDSERAAAYVATGEPMDKAGAYGIQGYGATLVERIEGDFFAVMGLPIVRMIALLEDAGWAYTFGALRRSS